MKGMVYIALEHRVPMEHSDPRNYRYRKVVVPRARLPPMATLRMMKFRPLTEWDGAREGTSRRHRRRADWAPITYWRRLHSPDIPLPATTSLPHPSSFTPFHSHPTPTV